MSRAQQFISPGAKTVRPAGTAFLIVNPASGGYSRKKVAAAVEHLRSAGIAPDVFSIRSPGEAAECCSTIYGICSEPLVIVAAGDGSINAVLNGLRPGTATMAVLPFGTSNVLAAEIGVGSVREGLARIARGVARPLSTGVLERAGSSLRFALMAGCGLDGAVVRDVRPREKRLLKQGAFALAALRRCLSWDAGRIEASTSAGIIDCHTVVVSNVSRYGGDFVLAPQADLFSPGFTVTCVTGARRRTYARILLDLAMGSGAATPELRQVSATEVEIRGTGPIQADGDYVGDGPARLRAVAGFARLIV